MSLGGDSDKCVGYYSFNNYGTPTYETAIDDITVTDSSNPWTYLGRFETDSASWEAASGGSVFNGIEIDISGATNTVSGSFTLNWEDVNGTDPENLPVVIDLGFIFKGGSGNQDAGSAFFFFDDEQLTVSPTSRSGSYNLLIDPTALSHEALFVRFGEASTDPDPAPGIPAPGTLALLGLGLAGMGYGTRRKSKVA